MVIGIGGMSGQVASVEPNTAGKPSKPRVGGPSWYRTARRRRVTTAEKRRRVPWRRPTTFATIRGADRALARGGAGYPTGPSHHGQTEGIMYSWLSQAATSTPSNHRPVLRGPRWHKRISREISERTHHCMRNAAHAAPANVASQVLRVLPLSAAAASDTSLTRGSPEVNESTSDHPVAATRPATTAQINRHRRRLKKISPDFPWGFMTFFMLSPPGTISIWRTTMAPSG